jgi:hypothetical protein
MTMKPYRYTVEGSGAGGNTFKTEGVITAEFHDSFNTAMIETFNKLTNGRALYGNPGAGCSGPYDIHAITIAQVKQ